MADRPILFNTEMVKAIMDGRKTQTRRLVVPDQALRRKGYQVVRHNQGYSLIYAEPFLLSDGKRERGAMIDKPCTEGDVLWVRETWHKDAGRYMYRANYSNDEKFYRDGKEVQLRWSPSIHMPKEAARIFLRVKDVRVERLQDITEDDVCAEGAEPLIVCKHEHPEINSDGSYGDMCWNGRCVCENCPIDRSYGELFGEIVWDSTIKPADRDKYGWKANPWVWVISFERCVRPKGWC